MGFTLARLQEVIRATYDAKDRRRGVEGTFMWFVEEVGELATALRSGSPEERAAELETEARLLRAADGRDAALKGELCAQLRGELAREKAFGEGAGQVKTSRMKIGKLEKALAERASELGVVTDAQGAVETEIATLKTSASGVKASPAMTQSMTRPMYCSTRSTRDEESTRTSGPRLGGGGRN